MTTRQSVPSLLQLPDPCLVVVLRCCADDPRSMCSAARAHSRLHQAAVVALSSITVALANQQQLDSLMLGYLSNHSQHIDSISLKGGEFVSIKLHQLPPGFTKLTSMAFKYLHPQLQPGSGYHGVLGPAAAPHLKQLRLDNCRLCDYN
mgnify:CR=1 FL=1